MQHNVESLVLFPYEIETELAGIGILEIHLFIIMGSYLGQHYIQCHIVENNWLCRGCRVRLDGVSWQSRDRLVRYGLFCLNSLWLGMANHTHNMDGGECDSCCKEYADDACCHLIREYAHQFLNGCSVWLVFSKGF